MSGQRRVTIPRDRFRIELETQPGTVRNCQHAIVVETPWFRDDLVHIRRAVDVFDEVGIRECRSQVQIGGETYCRVPAVRNESRAVLLRHPTDAPLLGDATDFRYIWLHDVERARL